MLIRDNFFQELLFYDKDDVPENIYKKLKKYYDDSETTAESLLLISHAASSLSTWIRAVYEYCNTLRSLDPKKRELKEAEQNLNHVRYINLFHFRFSFIFKLYNKVGKQVWT